MDDTAFPVVDDVTIDIERIDSSVEAAVEHVPPGPAELTAHRHARCHVVLCVAHEIDTTVEARVGWCRRTDGSADGPHVGRGRARRRAPLSGGRRDEGDDEESADDAVEV